MRVPHPDGAAAQTTVRRTAAADCTSTREPVAVPLASLDRIPGFGTVRHAGDTLLPNETVRESGVDLVVLPIRTTDAAAAWAGPPYHHPTRILDLAAGT